MVLAMAGPVKADMLDPLLGQCLAGCVDNGTATPITQTQAQTEFGFSISPPNQSGDLKLVFLVPNTTITAPVVTNLSGPGQGFSGPGGTGLVSGIQFTTGDLTTYLQNANPVMFGGLAGTSPPNPFNAFSTPDGNIGIPVAGFSVYAIDAGVFTGLLGPSNTTIDQFRDNGALPIGTEIVAFLNRGTANNPDWVSTAQSGQLQITTNAAVPGPIVGAGIPGLVTACLGLLGLNRQRRRRLV
jgi:hypothetical protein